MSAKPLSPNEVEDRRGELTQRWDENEARWIATVDRERARAEGAEAALAAAVAERDAWRAMDDQRHGRGDIVMIDYASEARRLRAAAESSTPPAEPCMRADIGDDCRCRACVERRVEQAEWTRDAECER